MTSIAKHRQARTRTRSRSAAALILAALFTIPMTGTASAQGLGSLDLFALLGLKSQAGAAAAPAPPPPPAPAEAQPAAIAAPAPDVSAPAVPAGSGSGRRVVYANGAQRVWLVNEDGSLHGTWLVSGRRGDPGPGTYSVFSRSRHARSKVPGVTMEYMVRFARTPGLPIGFHSIPVKKGSRIQSLDELGTYQSAGCVRQRYEDAIVMWEFAQIGTPVVVLR